MKQTPHYYTSLFALPSYLASCEKLSSASRQRLDAIDVKQAASPPARNGI